MALNYKELRFNMLCLFLMLIIFAVSAPCGNGLFF